MPCYTPPHSYCKHSEDAIEELICDVTDKIKTFSRLKKSQVTESQEFKELKKYADQVTNMLCNVMGEIEYQEPGIVLDQDVKEWWEKHKQWDRSREDKK